MCTWCTADDKGTRLGLGAGQGRGRWEKKRNVGRTIERELERGACLCRRVNRDRVVLARGDRAGGPLPRVLQPRVGVLDAQQLASPLPRIQPVDGG